MKTHAPVETLIELVSKSWPQALHAKAPGVWSVYRTYDSLIAAYANAIAPLGLQVADAEALVALRSQGEPYMLSPTQLCYFMLISSGGLTKVLKRLESQEWVERVPNPDDGRSQLVKLAAKGIDVLEEAVIAVAAVEKQSMAGITQEEHDQLQRLLAKMAANLNQEPTDC